MAAKHLSSGDIRKKELEDITTCCICTEVYTDPKALPCIHTFCMKCLQENGLKTNKGPGDEMPCPICRQMFKIPAEGFYGLPKHFIIDSLIQLSKVSGRCDMSRVLCSACLWKNEEEPGIDIATAHRSCAECKQKLCEHCCSEHTKNKLTCNHKLIPITENKGDQNPMMGQKQNVCELHGYKVLDVFCADCKSVVCAICFIDDHKKHEGSHVDKYVADFMKQIVSKAEAIEECRSKIQTMQENILEVKKDIKETVVETEREVATRVDELKQLADKQGAYLFQRICSIKQSKLKEVQMAADDVDMYLSCLETYNSYCQNVLAEGSASDICRAFSDLSITGMELQRQCQAMIENEVQSIDLRFRKSDGCPDNLIGEIEDEVDWKPKKGSPFAEQTERLCTADPILVQTIKPKVAEQHGKSINGFTILDKELFVVFDQLPEVEIYDSTTLIMSRWCYVRNLQFPMNIGSCKINKCLYIFEYCGTSASKEILRVDPNGHLIRKWSVGYGWGWGMSVTEESNLIVTAFDTDKLHEYSPDGQLIRKISLSPDVDFPYHANKFTNGQFVVCHGRLHGHHRLCIVDADGKLKKSFGGISGYTIGEDFTNDPVYLSIDANGFVMVVDRINSRLLLLDSDLQFKGEIISKEKHGSGYLRRILLDESNSRLFVADKQRILIFDFT